MQKAVVMNNHGNSLMSPSYLLEATGMPALILYEGHCYQGSWITVHKRQFFLKGCLFPWCNSLVTGYSVHFKLVLTTL